MTAATVILSVTFYKQSNVKSWWIGHILLGSKVQTLADHNPTCNVPVGPAGNGLHDEALIRSLLHPHYSNHFGHFSP